MLINIKDHTIINDQREYKNKHTWMINFSIRLSLRDWPDKNIYIPYLAKSSLGKVNLELQNTNPRAMMIKDST